MNGYNFTQRVRWALALAREEATRLHHEYVGTEHVLLGLLRQDTSVALSVIESFGVTPADLKTRIERVVGPGRAAENRGDVPYDSRAKRVLELAMAEARHLNDSYVGTQHLLLGLIHEERGIAAAVLAEFTITLDSARQHTTEVLAAGKLDDEAPQIRSPNVSGSAKGQAWGILPSAFASAPMAASIIEAMARDGTIASVFAAQGIDVAKLTAALRTAARQEPPGGVTDTSSNERPPTPPPA